jgi:hypothetical protein
MRESKSTTDETAVSEEALDLLGQGVGRDVEVLRLEAEREVAYTTTDEIGIEPCLSQTIEDAKRFGGNLRARNRMRVARDDTS